MGGGGLGSELYLVQQCPPPLPPAVTVLFELVPPNKQMSQLGGLLRQYVCFSLTCSGLQLRRRSASTVIIISMLTPVF